MQSDKKDINNKNQSLNQQIQNSQTDCQSIKAKLNEVRVTINQMCGLILAQENEY